MNIRCIAGAILIALIAGTAGWFLHTPPAASDKIADVSAPKVASTSTVNAPVAPAQVAAPAAPVAPKSAASSAATVSAPAPAPAADAGTPQPAPPELVSAIGEIGAVVHAGDLVSLIENYTPPQAMANMTPEQKSYLETQLQTQMQNPQAQQRVQAMAQMFDSLGGLTPNISADGAHATYQVPTPQGIAPAGSNLPSTLPMSFVKVNGKWYVNNGGM